MRNKFKGYYRPTAKDLEKIWNECLFVFDTNVLLNLYRYSAKTRKDLIRVFKKMKERIWMPHQVGIEFHKDRLGVISEQEESYSKLEENISKFLGNLKENLISNRHPFIENTEEHLKKLDVTLKTITDKLVEGKKEVGGRNDEDHILTEVTNLFEGRVGECYKQDRLNIIYNDGKLRYDNELPPGYKDQKDKKGNNKYGDLIIWYQIIDKSGESKKPIIFITDEKKEDWWWINKGKIVGARPELIQEFFDKTGCDFYMYRVEPFLQFAEKYLETKVDETTYKEIKDVQKRMLDAQERINRINEILSRADLKEKVEKMNLNTENLKNLNELILKNDIINSTANVNLEVMKKYLNDNINLGLLNTPLNLNNLLMYIKNKNEDKGEKT